MSESLANGSIYSVAATYGADIPVTVLTNANPAVATATAHGLSNGDIVEATSGWEGGVGVNNRIFKVSGVTSNTFELSGLNTTSTDRFPAGTGIGSVRKILTWTTIAQVLDAASSGGEQQYLQWVYLADGIQRQKKTFKNARSLRLTMADDSNLPYYAILRAADEDGVNRAVRLVLPNLDTIYYNMDVSFNDEPTINANDLLKIEATLSQVAKFTRYDV